MLAMQSKLHKLNSLGGELFLGEKRPLAASLSMKKGQGGEESAIHSGKEIPAKLITVFPGGM